MENTAEQQRQEQRGCAKFWGPTKPFLGNETGIESGASYYVPTFVLFAARFIMLCVCVGSIILMIVENRFSLVFVSNWSFLVFTISMALLTITSLLLLIRRHGVANKLARFVIPFHFVAASAALYIVPVYWALLFRPPVLYSQAIVHGGTLLMYLLDIALGAMIRFKIQYTVFTFGYFLLYVVFLWIRYAIWRDHPDFFWPYDFLDINKTAPGLLAGIYIGLMVFTIAISVIIVLTNRLIPLCVTPVSFSNKNQAMNREENGKENERSAV